MYKRINGLTRVGPIKSTKITQLDFFFNFLNFLAKSELKQEDMAVLVFKKRHGVIKGFRSGPTANDPISPMWRVASIQ